MFNPTLATLQYFTYIDTDNDGDPTGTVTVGDHHWEDIVAIRTFGTDDFAIAGTFGGTFGTSAANPNNENAADSYKVYITAANVPVGAVAAADGTRSATADITDGAASDVFMYAARFTNFTTLSYGTYTDQNEDIQLNDMILLGDGRIAFSGAADCGDDDDCTNNDSTPLVNDFAVNGGAGVNADNSVEGIVAVINLTGEFAQLSRIGGEGQDVFNGMLDLNGFLYLTGRTSSDPLILNSPDEGVTFDPYDTTYGGGLSDAIIARVPYSGCTGAGAPGACANLGTWRATYLGGTATDLGNALESYLEGVFLFGSTTSAGAPASPFPAPPPLVSPPSISVAARTSAPPTAVASTSSSLLSVAGSTA